MPILHKILVSVFAITASIGMAQEGPLSSNEPSNPFATFSWTAPTSYENGDPLVAKEDLSNYTLTCVNVDDSAIQTSKEIIAVAARLSTQKEELFPEFGTYGCSLTATAKNGFTSRPSEEVRVTYADVSAPSAPTNFLFITDSPYFK